MYSFVAVQRIGIVSRMCKVISSTSGIKSCRQQQQAGEGGLAGFRRIELHNWNLYVLNTVKTCLRAQAGVLWLKLRNSLAGDEKAPLISLVRGRSCRMVSGKSSNRSTLRNRHRNSMEGLLLFNLTVKLSFIGDFWQSLTESKSPEGVQTAAPLWIHSVPFFPHCTS